MSKKLPAIASAGSERTSTTATKATARRASSPRVGQREDDRRDEQAGDEPDAAAELERPELGGGHRREREEASRRAIRLGPRQREREELAKRAMSAAAPPPYAAPERVRVEERRLRGDERRTARAGAVRGRAAAVSS